MQRPEWMSQVDYKRLRKETQDAIDLHLKGTVVFQSRDKKGKGRTARVKTKTKLS
jgi:hypothetical protein